MSLDNQQVNNKKSPPCQVGAQSRSQENTSCANSGVNSLAAVAIAISKHDEVNLQQQQQLPSMSTSSQFIADLAYSSGIDKLLLASMVGDTTSSSNHSQSTNNMPTYSSNSSSMQQNMAMSMPHKFAAPPPQQRLFLAPSATASQVPYIPVGRGIGNTGGLNYSNNSQMSTATRESMMNIPTPRNKSELELYKLLEKANLLNYFGTFLSCGGDDVQQLSDADEEEFLEIMTLIGMTQKPLHVRRLQRALYEWRESRGEIFDSPYKRPNPNNLSTAPQANSYHFIGRHQQQQSPASHHLRSAHHHLNYTSGLHNLHQQQQTFNGNYNDNERNQSRSSTTIMVESPAPTPNSISSSQALTTSDLNTTSNSSTLAPQPQYSSPHEVLIGAPKRPRLMDSIKPRDLTKLITVDDLDEDKLGSDAN